jgi:hypothetical protein
VRNGGGGSDGSRKARSQKRALTPKEKKTKRIGNEMNDVIDEKVEAD